MLYEPVVTSRSFYTRDTHFPQKLRDSINSRRINIIFLPPIMIFRPHQTTAVSIAGTRFNYWSWCKILHLNAIALVQCFIDWYHMFEEIKPWKSSACWAAWRRETGIWITRIPLFLTRRYFKSHLRNQFLIIFSSRGLTTNTWKGKKWS